MKKASLNFNFGSLTLNGIIIKRNSKILILGEKNLSEISGHQYPFRGYFYFKVKNRQKWTTRFPCSEDEKATL